MICLTKGVAPSQATGLLIFLTTAPIMKSIDLNILQKEIIAIVINNRPEKIVFTKKEMGQLYDLAVKYKNNCMSRKECILERRGGKTKDWVAAFGVIMVIITVLNNNNIEGFQVPQREIVPPHLQWLYGNQQSEIISNMARLLIQ